jgi:signal peptide peptidase SppA
MNITDILNSPWALMPEKLLDIRAIYLSRLAGEKADVASIEARLGRPLENKREGYKVHNGVAVIPVEGIVAKKMNLLTQISGGTSTQVLQQEIADAAADPMVNAIVLVIDSPGGEVDGTQAAADLVRSVRGTKPIVALGDGLMASAAYWIGSAADKVYITADTTAVGSIGIVATHTDYSKAEEQRGIRITEITAGKYKRIASQHEPLSDEGRASIQDQVDHLYSVFVDAVAANRGVSTDTVLTKMADGRVFLGKNAIAAGLVDGISSLKAIVGELNDRRPKVFAATTASTAASASTSTAPLVAVEATSTKIPTSDDYMRRFNQYKHQPGMSQFEAMKRALHEHTLETQLAEVAQMHQHREQTNQPLQGETKTMTLQTTPATQQASQDPIELARELASAARDYVASEARAGRTVSYADAVYHVSSLRTPDAVAAKQEPLRLATNATDEEKIAHAKRLAARATTYRAEQEALLGRRITIAQAVAEISRQQQ